MQKCIHAKPFVKWAGGKRQLLDVFQRLYPLKHLKKGRIRKYVEPFVGSGAVFFDIIRQFKIEEYYISDLNEDLINTYLAVKYSAKELIERLEIKQKEYQSLSTEQMKQYYYEIRENYNKNKQNLNYDEIERASQFIFLNRTCFNGLYRINSKSEFNVPQGKYKNPKICDKDNLLKVSEALKEVNVTRRGYKDCLEIINDDTFVYFDPPYRPLNLTSNFTSYSGNFGETDQVELANFYKKLNQEKGCFLMLSNSDPSNVDPSDKFFQKHYVGPGIKIKKVCANRNINSKAQRRGGISELVIINYPLGR